MRFDWRAIRPGWYLLLLLLLYGAVVTVVAARQGERIGELRAELTAEEEGEEEQEGEPAQAQAISPLWFPVPGATLPDDPAYLPNAPRPYRQGVSQGFDFYDGHSGVPIPYGAAVVAAAPGTVVRADVSYRDEGPEEWQLLMESVAAGADQDQLDRLRGRQLWIEADDGRLLRYAHLSAIREGLRSGQRVDRGEVVGFVGNSGTDEGVAGTTRGARLHFEIWQDDSFFGEGMDPEEVRIAAASLFGP